MVLTILPAIRPRPSPIETGGFETIAPLDSAMEYGASELAAGRIIHMMGTLAGAVGSAILVGIAAAVAVLPTFSASLVYSVCLLAMLGCSAAYNLASDASRRGFLRQLDHPQRNMAQLRAGRGQLSLRSYSAWGGDGPNVRRHLFTI